MSRLSAFGIHLGISFIIFLALAYLVVFEWYPGLFFDTDGGWRGMRIIVAVDMVLGPLLTLVVFKAGKPGLKTDLTLIGLLQAVCLVAGTWIVAGERPLSVVYNDGRFTVMTADDYQNDAGIDIPDLHLFPGDNPKWVMVEVPQELQAQADFRSSAFRSGRLISSLAELYQPFDTKHPQFTDQALDYSIILAKDGGQAAIDAWIAEHGGSMQDYGFYTFSTRYTHAYLGFAKATGERLGLLSVLAY